MMHWRALAAAMTAVAVTAAPAASAQNKRELEQAAFVIAVPRLEGFDHPPPAIAAAPWTRAACLTGLVEADGRLRGSERTWVHLFYDAKQLWVAFRCDGRGRGALRQAITERDGKVWRDDSIEIMLDPANTGERYYHCIVNSIGAVFDQYDGNPQWDGQPSVLASIDDKGWSAVVGLTFASMKTRPPQPGDAWRVNFIRNLPANTSDAPEGAARPAVRTAWCPERVIEGGRKQLGQVLFREPNAPAQRLRDLEPLLIGANRLMVDPAGAAGIRLTGLTEGDEPVFEQQPELKKDGTVPFTIADDRARHIRVSFEDAQKRLLGRGVYPLVSPELKRQTDSLSGMIDEIEQGRARMSQAARQRARNLLDEARPVLSRAREMVKNAAKSDPAAWVGLHDAVTAWALKLDDAACLASTLKWYPEAAFGVGIESTMRKVMIRDFQFAGRFTDRCDLALARNEHEGLQVAVMPFEQDLADVSVEVSPLRGQNGAGGFRGTVRVSLVGHVKATGPQPYEVAYSGWYPDPLLSFQRRCDIHAGENVAFWIDVATTADTPAGLYTGAIRVTAAGRLPVSLPLQVTVWDFALPRGTHLRNAFTYHEHGVGRFYGPRWTREMRYRYYDFLLEHRLNIDHLYRGERPDLEVVRYGVARGMNAFNVGSEFLQTHDDRSARQEIERYFSQIVESGLLKHAYVYGFDEVRKERFADVREAFSAVRRRFAGLRTMTTAVDDSYGRDSGLRDVVDIWVPTTDRYDRSAARALRAEGRDMWWYVCVVPVRPYANFFVEYDAIEPRLLTGAMSFKYDVGGFLYYLVNAWDENRKVVGPGPYTDWNPASFKHPEKGTIANGDGSLMCAGPDGPISTIRLENIRDGFEDYEYLWLLRDRAQTVRAQASTPARQAFLARAEALLTVPDRVVDTVIRYTRDPQALVAYRADVAAAILEAGRLLAMKAGNPQ